jgi:DNA polymerase III subunit alpha
MDTFEDTCMQIVGLRKQEEAGQFSLFAGGGKEGLPQIEDRPVPIDENPKPILLAQEKEVLGLYVSDHPLLGVEGLLGRMTDCSVSALAERTPGDVLTVGGTAAALRKKVTRRGEVMILLDLEDLSGASVEVIVFPKVAEQHAALLRPDAILLVKGRVDRDARDDSVKLVALEVHEPKLGDETPLVIRLPLDRCTPRFVGQLKEVLGCHPGATQVFLHLSHSAKTTVLRLGSEFWVDSRNGLHAELKALLGPEALTPL